MPVGAALRSCPMDCLCRFGSSSLYPKLLTRRADRGNSRFGRRDVRVSFQNAHHMMGLCTDGALGEALDALQIMEGEGIVASRETCASLLQRCSKLKSLSQAKLVHAYIAKNGLESQGCLGDLAVNMFVKCGSLHDAVEVFNRLPERTVFSWTVLISGYTDQGRVDEAFKAYRQMKMEGVKPNSYTYVSMLKACRSLADLQAGKQIHTEVLATRSFNLFVGTVLISMYAKCGSMKDARDVFDKLEQPNVVSWNAMIAGYAQNKQSDLALQLFSQMQEGGVQSDKWTFVSALKACSGLAALEGETLTHGQGVKLESLWRGKIIHSEAVGRGYESDVFVANTLVHMYATCGSIREARHMFDKLLHRDLVSWNAVIASYAQQQQGEEALQLYRQMQDGGVEPDKWTLVSVLKACGSLATERKTCIEGQTLKLEPLRMVKAVHNLAVRLGCISDRFVGNTLVNMYARCGGLHQARHVFKNLVHKDVVTWNGLIAGYCEQEEGSRAIELYSEMQAEGVQPNRHTFVSVLRACGSLAGTETDTLLHGKPLKAQSLGIGQKIHGAVVRHGYEEDPHVSAALISMYSRCGSISDAQLVFDTLQQRNLMSWNALLAGYAQHEEGEQSFNVYLRMQEDGVKPDCRTMSSLLKACGSLAAKEQEVVVDGQSVTPNSLSKVKSIHGSVVRWGFESDATVGNALVHAYSKCGSMVQAQQVFAGLDEPGLVTWTAMVAGYTKQEQGHKALQLSRQLLGSSLEPDDATFVSILKACAFVGALEVCRQIHHHLLGRIDSSMLVANTLIHAYGKCGSMLAAQRVFDSLSHPDVVSWTALMAGYARQGASTRIVQCFDEMRKVGEDPDEATFIPLLTACSHAGWVDRGLEYFESMGREFGIPATIQHYAVLVDLLGRAGLFGKAENLISRMPMQPDLAIWMSLLSACRKYVNVEVGRRAFNCAVSLAPAHSAAYVLMSHIYNCAEMFEDAFQLLEVKAAAVSWKELGQSWIEHGQEVHVFVAGDRVHHQMWQILAVLKDISVSAHLGRAQ